MDQFRQPDRPFEQQPDQFFILGTHPTLISTCPAAASASCQFETGHEPSCDFAEHRFWRWGLLTPHQWSLVTMYYDFRSPTKDDCGELRLNAGIDAADMGSSNSYTSFGSDPTLASDITLDDVFGTSRLVLGASRALEYQVTLYAGSGADATFDEMALYDFGGATLGAPAPPATLLSPGTLASNRFRQGRYYRESAYPDTGGLLRALGPIRNAAE